MIHIKLDLELEFHVYTREEGMDSSAITRSHRTRKLYQIKNKQSMIKEFRRGE